MTFSFTVTLTVPFETFVAVRESSSPDRDPELINQVAHDTTYAVIHALKGDRYDINLHPNGEIHCKAPRPITVRIMKLSDGQYFTCDIPSNASARQLACKIHDERDIPLLKQVLMFHGTILFRRDPDKSIDLRLDQAGVSDGARVVLGWRF